MSPPPRFDVDLFFITRFDSSCIWHGDDREIEGEITKQGLGFYEIFASRAPNLQYISIAMRCPARLAGVLEDVPTITASLTTSRIQHTGPIFRTWGTHCHEFESNLAQLFEPRRTSDRRRRVHSRRGSSTLRALGVVGQCPNLSGNYKLLDDMPIKIHQPKRYQDHVLYLYSPHKESVGTSVKP
ncbi:hypothetical protein Hypma_016303 [Hypsizygus marmoreus]|uniref:Uncharacterized protein n=1 Tax=Hypsizygus marmoreus TaxID=39966 RepID=A0A369IZQ9_HYPMA|nr:hypothetical protein Hypma_016303 [Hypsizygus marmoreus]